VGRFISKAQRLLKLWRREPREDSALRQKLLLLPTEQQRVTGSLV